MMPMLLLPVAATADAASSRAAPHTVLATCATPTPFPPGLPDSIWDVSLTSDGRRAWAVATVRAEAIPYRSPETPGLQGIDFAQDGSLVAWRREAYAARYDLGSGRVTVCDLQANHHVAADGTDNIVGRRDDRSRARVEGERLWTWIGYALGDGAVALDPTEAVRVELVSFATTTDPGVVTAAEATMDRCEHMEVDEDG